MNRGAHKTAPSLPITELRIGPCHRCTSLRGSLRRRSPEPVGPSGRGGGSTASQERGDARPCANARQCHSSSRARRSPAMGAGWSRAPFAPSPRLATVARVVRNLQVLIMLNCFDARPNK